MSSLRRHWGKALLALSLLAVVGGWAWRALRGTAVRAEAVRRADIVQTVLVSGRVLPPAEVELRPRVEGAVIELPVGDGEEITEGVVLARIDATEAEAEVARARASLARVQAANGRSRRIAPQVAQQQLSRAEVQLAQARRTLEQAQSLVRSGAWPPDRLAAARDALAEAEAGERAARLELVATRGADRRAADAAVDEALAALELAEQRLAHTTLRAPISGTLLERRVEVGDTARPGSILFVIASAGPPILSVLPDERYLAQLELGQRAVAQADAYPDRPFEARVRFIAPAIDADRGTVEVRLLPTETIDFLRPNLTISVEIEVARAEGALVLPAALVHDAATDSPWAWVAEGGRLARRPLVLGLRGDEHLEIREGLREGERIPEVEGPRLEAGDRVRVEP